ncbi:MAG: DUF1475 family protein [Chloroflexi bacterium]|nr:DUF1475 family protein [Chloroflexota bacterium]
MKLAKTISLIGVFAMTAVLIYAFTRGDFFAEGSQLLSMPWGIVSLVDLYVGFSLFSMWVIYREKSALRSIIWVAFIMVLGFFTVSVYIYIALQSSRDDWNRFFHGRRYPISA